MSNLAINPQRRATLGCISIEKIGEKCRQEFLPRYSFEDSVTFSVMETLAKLTVSTAKERGRVSTFPPLSSLPLDNSRTNRGNLAGAETFFICIFTRYAVAVSRAN